MRLSTHTALTLNALDNVIIFLLLQKYEVNPRKGFYSSFFLDSEGSLAQFHKMDGDVGGSSTLRIKRIHLEAYISPKIINWFISPRPYSFFEFPNGLHLKRP